jgi:hypothetical protein
MGLLDTLRGRTKPVRANLDALFTLPTAAVTLEAGEGAVTSGHAGVCWASPSGRSAADVKAEIEALLELPDSGDSGSGESGSGDSVDPGTATGQAGGDGGSQTQMTQAEDSFGYRWLLVDDPSLETLVAQVHLINSTLTDNGWGPQLLCSVFGMVPSAGAGADAKPFFLVYLYKRGTFYPFAPTGKQERDSTYELHLRAVIGADLPIEADVSRWFPLWDLPVH